jgi:hypothetical protein
MCTHHFSCCRYASKPLAHSNAAQDPLRRLQVSLSFCCCFVQSKRGACVSLPSLPCAVRVTLLAVIWQPSAMMASPMRASSASATFDGQYVQPTREGLTALSITLTYLFNSQGSNGVSCLQGSWAKLAVLFGPHYSRLLVYWIRWTLFVLCKCLYTHNVHRCLVGIAINVANPFLSCSSVTVLDTPVSPPQPMALRLSHAYGLQ